MARAPKITYELLQRWIAAGWGQGHGENYKPWLQLRRWNSSPNSTQIYGRIPPFYRSCNFMSRSEWLLALLFAWLGADVREQFPAWPWPHPHPLYGLDSELDGRLAWSTGLIDLCAASGINHGYFVGTSIPYVWTLDLVLTIRWRALRYPRCTVVSVKPLESERIKEPDPINRSLEKLEIERRYCEELGVPYFVADRTLYPGHLLGQLEWLANAAYPLNDKLASIMMRFLDLYAIRSDEFSLSEWIERLQVDFGLTKWEADYLIQHCLWHQTIDCDLSQYVDMRTATKHGGRDLRQRLQKTLEAKPCILKF